MQDALPKYIVFITGTFISNTCWGEWIIYFENKGYKCIAQAWPYKDASSEELRNRPSDDPIALNTINSLTDHFAAIISSLPKKPILIGHSLGGLCYCKWNVLVTRDGGRKQILLFTGCRELTNKIK